MIAVVGLPGLIFSVFALPTAAPFIPLLIVLGS